MFLEKNTMTLDDREGVLLIIPILSLSRQERFLGVSSQRYLVLNIEFTIAF